MTTESKVTQTPKLITLNCSGGISLGAYMAGVFYELTKEAIKPDAKINIDIITGASAGAMSGVLAAYCLLKGTTNQLFESSEEDSPLYKAWVEQADIEAIDSMAVMLSSFKDGLQATLESFEDNFKKSIAKYEKSSNTITKTIAKLFPGLNKNPTNLKTSRQRTSLSVLSGKAIEDIARLVQDPPQITPDTKPLALLMTLTNLQGILEQIDLSDYSTEEDIKAITSAESRQFLFHCGVPQETMNQMWAKAVAGSRASGAFPVAFPTIWDHSSISSVNLEFLSDDYFQPGTNRTALNNKELGAIRENNIDDTQLVFLYTDGGILEGLPLLKGIELEAELRSNQKIEPETQLEDFQKEFKEQAPTIRYERLHVYIRPIPIENFKSEKRLTQGHFTMLEVGISGLTLPKNEHDSIRLKEIKRRNQMVAAKQNLLKLLKNKGIGDLNPIKKILEEAIPYQHIELRPITAGMIGKLAEPQIHPKLSKLLPIYAAMPRHVQASLQEGNAATLLASDFLGAFGGFFDKRYRVHDFIMGRICGMIWLAEHCDVEITDEEVQAIAQQVKTHILNEDPQPSDLKLSQKLRIGRIILRALRIVLIESEIIGLAWLVVLGILKVAAILSVAILEVLLTVILVICDLMEKSQQKVMGN
jgi:hypothetical protein